MSPDPINSRIADSGLRYYEWNGQHLMSVTSLRRAVGMSIGLHNWAVGEVIDGAIEVMGDPENDELDHTELKKRIRKRGTLKRDEAASLGTQVHELAADNIQPAALPDEDERKGFLQRYYEAVGHLGWKIVCNEVQVFNLTERYAGSLDLIAYDFEDDKYILVDIKTGKGTYPDAALQLDMYRRAEFCGGYDPIDETDVQDPEATEFLKGVTGMGILHIRPDVPPDEAFIEIAITDELTRAAQRMVGFAHWVEKHPDMEGLKL